MRLGLLIILFTSTILKAGEFIEVVSNPTGSPLGANYNIPASGALQVLADSALFTRAVDLCGELKELVESGRGLSHAAFNDLVLQASGMVNDSLSSAAINYYLACLAQRSGLQKSLEARFVSYCKARLKRNSYGAHYLNLLENPRLMSEIESKDSHRSRRHGVKRVHFPTDSDLEDVREVTPVGRMLSTAFHNQVQRAQDAAGRAEKERLKKEESSLIDSLRVHRAKKASLGDIVQRFDENGEVDLSCHLSDEESDEE